MPVDEPPGLLLREDDRRLFHAQRVEDALFQRHVVGLPEAPRDEVAEPHEAVVRILVVVEIAEDLRRR
jgi:hypothetical protein